MCLLYFPWTAMKVFSPAMNISGTCTVVEAISPSIASNVVTGENFIDNTIMTLPSRGSGYISDSEHELYNSSHNVVPDKLIESKRLVGPIVSEILCNWLSKEKSVPYRSINRLLEAFIDNGFYVPKTTSILLPRENSKVLKIKAMGDHGDYYHCDDWPNHLRNYAEKSCLPENKISLYVNIDGLGLFNPLGVSKNTVYPILVKIAELPSKIFCAGIYCSNDYFNKSMPPANELLAEFFNDIESTKRMIS